MGLAMPAVSQALQGAAGYVAAGGCLSAGSRISERAKDQTLVCEVTTEGKAGLSSQVTMGVMTTPAGGSGAPQYQHGCQAWGWDCEWDQKVSVMGRGGLRQL